MRVKLKKDSNKITIEYLIKQIDYIVFKAFVIIAIRN